VGQCEIVQLVQIIAISGNGSNLPFTSIGLAFRCLPLCVVVGVVVGVVVVAAAAACCCLLLSLLVACCCLLLLVVVERLFVMAARTISISEVPTTPIAGQKTGTSGLRKKTAEFRSANYLANWIQSLFRTLDSSGLVGSTLVVGGDGRFWTQEAVHIIVRIAAANGVAKLLVGHNGVLSTPAVSTIIRRRKAFGM
jgi:hypothetical protein